MLKDRYQEGYQAALEKVGGLSPGVFGEAAPRVDPFKAVFTKSVDSAAGITTKATNQAIGPKRARPSFKGVPGYGTD